MARKLSREEERLFHEALSVEQTDWPDKKPEDPAATPRPTEEQQRTLPVELAAWVCQRGTKEKA